MENKDFDTWVYHPTKEAKIIKHSESGELHKAGWRSTPASFHPHNIVKDDNELFALLPHLSHEQIDSVLQVDGLAKEHVGLISVEVEGRKKAKQKKGG